MPDIILDTVFTNPNLPIAPEPGFFATFDQPDGPVGRTSVGNRLWVPESLPTATAHWPLMVASGKAVRGAGNATTMGTRTAWVVDAEDSDGVLIGKVGALGDATLTLALRYVDINNYIAVGCRQSSSSLIYQFVKRVGGTQSTVASTGSVASAGGDVIHVTAAGTSVTVSVNGTTIFGGVRTIADFANSTRHGVLLQSASSGIESWEEVGFSAAS